MSARERPAADLQLARTEVARLKRELEETNRGVLAMVAELDDAAQQWQATFDAISDGLILVGPDGRTVRANQAFAALAGRPQEMVLGAPAADVLRSVFGDAGRLDDLTVSAVSGGHLHAERGAGDRWFEIRVYPVGAGPHDLGQVIIVSDATERRRLAEAERARSARELETTRLRERAERMSQLEKVKSEFLQLASHELRGPVGIMRGYLSMVADGSLGPVPGRLAEILPVLQSKAQEMHMLVEQLLETARLEDSRLVLKPSRGDLREIVREAVAIVRTTRKAADIQYDSSGAEPVLVDVDSARVVNVVANLLDNAVKYSEDSREVRCRVWTDQGRALVSVTDRGFGIGAEDMPRLFTRFGRIVTAENSHIQGTGLGLYLARELARMHGGDIECRSVAGRGSTFTLTLPLTSQQDV